MVQAHDAVVFWCSTGFQPVHFMTTQHTDARVENPYYRAEEESMQPTKKLAAGSGSSVVVDRCQVCDSTELDPVVFIGYLPPVNSMPTIGTRPAEQPAYPAQVLRCRRCTLVQLGLVVDPAILFPPEYPYTSGTTKILHENFAEMAQEVASLYPLSNKDLVVDIGSNDGTLLSNFATRARCTASSRPMPANSPLSAASPR